MGLHFVLGLEQILPVGAVQLKLVWTVTPVWRSGLQLVAKQAQEWIFASVQGRVTGRPLKRVFEMGPGLQLAREQVQGL